MKALTICQPYAELIARGEKLVENRTWVTSYRGPLAIHAGKSRAWLDDGDLERYPTMAWGAVVAIANLAGCHRIDQLPDYLKDHEHANGPWCWHVTNVVRLSPPATVSGAQGLWTPDRRDWLHWLSLARQTREA